MTDGVDVVISASDESVVFQVLSDFFERLARGDVGEAARLFTEDVGREVFTPQEKDDYNRCVCVCVCVCVRAHASVRACTCVCECV